ncbi:AAA family ATPase [Streptomyces sp. NPDC005648]|uniref:ATP-binding protein n=1 Tax=Streptomyces sp. NPDC005648 TaxID=3157044 RepID=UPI00339F6413
MAAEYPFVGREDVLGELRGALGRAAAGRGGLVTLTGPAGAGKTRAAEEVAAQAGAFRTLWTWCPPETVGRAFRPWSRPLRELVADDAACGRLVAASPPLRALVSGAGPGVLHGADPEAARLRLTADVAELLATAARRRPLLLILDDVHAADASSLRLLLETADAARTMPVLLLGTARDEEVAWREGVPDGGRGDGPVGRGRVWAQLLRRGRALGVGPLAERDVAALVEAVTGAVPESGEVRALVRRTGGDAFFVTELLRAGSWGERAGERGGAGVPPGAVRAAVDDRLADLTPRARRVLDVAAVLGTRFRLDVLAEGAEVPLGEVRSLLGEAAAAGLLAEVGADRGAFRHDLLRDAVYDTLGFADRTALHHTVADVLAGYARRGRDTAPAEVAHHLLLSGPDHASRAAAYAHEAATRAEAMFAFEDASRWYERAVEALGVGGGGAPGAAGGRGTGQVDGGAARAGGDRVELVELLLGLGAARLGAGEREAARDALLTAAGMAREVDRPDLLARAALGLGTGPVGFEVDLEDREQVNLLTEARTALTPAPNRTDAQPNHPEPNHAEPNHPEPNHPEPDPHRPADIGRPSATPNDSAPAPAIQPARPAHPENPQADPDFSEADRNRVAAGPDQPGRSGRRTAQPDGSVWSDRVRANAEPDFSDAEWGRSARMGRRSAQSGRPGRPGRSGAGPRPDDARPLVASALSGVRRFSGSLRRPGPPSPLALRAAVTARLSLAAGLLEPEAGRLALAEEALALAREVGDPATLATALAALCDARPGPDHCRDRLTWSAEIVATARELRDPVLELLGRRLRLVAFMETGAFAEADVEAAAYEAVVRPLRRPLYAWYVPLWRGTRALMEGRFQDCSAALDEVEELGRRSGSANAALLAVTQRWCLYTETDDLTGLERIRSEAAVLEHSPMLWPRVTLALLATQFGHHDEAARRLSAVAPRLGGATRDSEWLPMLAQAAETVAAMQSHPAAPALYDLLAPYAGLFAVEGIGAAVRGPVDRHLALLAAAMGDPDRADRHRTTALRAAEAAGAVALTERIRGERGEEERGGGGGADAEMGMGMGRGTGTGRGTGVRAGTGTGMTAVPGPESAPADAPTPAPDPALFRHEGPFWHLRYAGRDVRLPDSKGLRDLAVLLARPGTPVPAVELASPGAPGASRGSGQGGGLGPGLHPQGDAGEVVDAAARAAYRRRLRELEDEARDADASGDAGRSERAAVERDALVAQLAAAYGIGGRVRRTGSPVERARTTVTARIRAAVRRIAEVHPELGRHLGTAVRTGTLCVYQPERPPPWRL